MGISLIENLKFSSVDELQKTQLLGPVTYRVSPDYKDKTKIYTFCRDNFTELSSQSIRQCFAQGYVILNGQFLPASHSSESKRLHDGDEISISLCWESIIRESETFLDMSVIEENEHFSVIEKGPGIDTSRDALFGVCFRLKLWSGDFFNSARAVYEIPRAHSGIMLIVKNENSYQHVVKLIQDDHLRISLSTIVCAQVPITDTAVTFTLHNSAEFQSFEIKSSRQCQSRSRDMLSLIEVELSFQLHSFISTQNSTNWLSQALQSTCHHLTHCLCLPVVGYEKIMNSQHGIFVSWHKITVRDATDTIAVHSISLPPKFNKFLSTEEKLFIKAQANSARKEEEAETKYLQQIQLLRSIPTTASGSTEVEANATELICCNTGTSQSERVSFCGLVFNVSAHVMTPRASSETVVQTACDHLYSDYLMTPETSMRRLNIVDLGTGSGNLLISLIYLIIQRKPSAVDLSVQGIGVDLSTSALETAAKNRSMLLPLLQHINNKTYIDSIVNNDTEQCDDKNLKEGHNEVSINFHVGDFASVERLAMLFQQQCRHLAIDMIICNPPYSSRREQRISESVKRQDPSLALFAHDTDALWAYRQLASTLSHPSLSPFFTPNKTLLVLEIGHGQETQVHRIFDSVSSNVWQLIDTRRDHKNLQRAMVFRYSR